MVYRFVIAPQRLPYIHAALLVAGTYHMREGLQ
jgi:hypothetical protein